MESDRIDSAEKHLPPQADEKANDMRRNAGAASRPTDAYIPPASQLHYRVAERCSRSCSFDGIHGQKDGMSNRQTAKTPLFRRSPNTFPRRREKQNPCAKMFAN